jgi:2-dehydro-3-deoxygalactonokinase
MSSDKNAVLLALDWGTSSLRAYLMDGGGNVLGSRSAGWGIMHLPEGGFAGALDILCGDLLKDHPELPVIASGMVGSAQGWLEVPYVAAPASPESVAQGMRHAAGPHGRQVAIVPGVLQDGRTPNVMRGEETQVFGALSIAPDIFGAAGEGIVVLPGTHSKWVHVQEGRIVSFLTFMTGEMYAVLRQHSILGRLMQDEGALDPQGFDRGLSEAAEENAGGLLSSLFSVRTLGLTGRLRQSQLGDYLSGLLIGHEINEARRLFAAQLDTGCPLILIGADELCRRYEPALSSFSLRVQDRDFRDAAPAGLWNIACRAGLIARKSLPC